MNPNESPLTAVPLKSRSLKHLTEDATVGLLRPEVIEAAMAAAGCKRGEDGGFYPEIQLREWERWHGTHSIVRPRHAAREPSVQVILVGADGAVLLDAALLVTLAG